MKPLSSDFTNVFASSSHLDTLFWNVNRRHSQQRRRRRGRRRQLLRRRVDRGPLKRRQEVVLHPDEQFPGLPGVLEVERPEVISEAAFPRPDDGDEAEVSQVLFFVDGPVPTLQDDGHVQLLHHLEQRTILDLGPHKELWPDCNAWEPERAPTRSKTWTAY